MGGRGWGGPWRSVGCGVAWPFLLQPWSGPVPALGPAQPLTPPGHVAHLVSWGGPSRLPLGSGLCPVLPPSCVAAPGPGPLGSWARGKNNGSAKSRPWPPTPTPLMSPGEGQGPGGVSGEDSVAPGDWRPSPASGNGRGTQPGHLRSAPSRLCEAPHPARPNLSQVRCPPRVAGGAQGSSPRGVWRDAGSCEELGAPGGPGKLTPA